MDFKRKLFGTTALLALTIGLSVFVTGCESDDDNNIMKAQDCLNKVEGDGSNAGSCRSYVANLTTPQAYMLRCSIEFVYGGMTTSKVKTAFETLAQSSAESQEAELVSLLALTDPNGSGPADHLALAETAFSLCKNSDAAGLIYVAGLSRIGTLLTFAAGAGGNIQQTISNCQATPSSCDQAAIGETVSAVADSYCVGDTAQSDVCQSFLEAQAGGADSAAIGQAILDNWDGTP